MGNKINALIFEDAQTGIVCFDENNRLINSNTKIKEILSIESENKIVDSLLDLIYKNEKEKKNSNSIIIDDT